ncbi:MAG: hypothetical protein K6G91_06050 [Kiritimatiellae bacterium]|nr:hypothetical protein [Kiritimatiellia bacterium]
MAADTRIACLVLALLPAVAAQCAAPLQIAPPLGPDGRVRRVAPLRPGEASVPRLSRPEAEPFASRRAAEEARMRLDERVRKSLSAARAMRSATETSLGGGDDVRRRMLQAGVAPDQVDFALGQIRDAVPKLREAGRAIERRLAEGEGRPE